MPADAPARMTFGNPTYDAGGEGKCWQLWHAGMRNGPYCQLDEDHDGLHRGAGLEWTHSPGVSYETAEKFLAAYRCIPNAYHEVTLRDDGVVEMTLCGFESAVMFNGIGLSFDD